MKTVRIRPEGPFNQVPRSDTLFGAICWGVHRSRGEDGLEELLKAFAAGDPPFRISSAFPFVTGEWPDTHRDAPTYLLPRPRLPVPVEDPSKVSDERIDAMDDWKRLKYVPAAVFESLARGRLSPGDIIDALQTDPTVIDGIEYVHNDELLLPDAALPDDPTGGEELVPPGLDPTEEYSPVVETERVRNAVNRLKQSTEGQVFTEQTVAVAPNAGLHVGVKGDEETVVEGLSLIQDRGIGGGRSVGRGQFTLDGTDDVDLPDPDHTSESICSLSLTIPRDEELDRLDDAYFEVETRKGVLGERAQTGSDIWKKRVIALAEGSVLPSGDRPAGHNPIVDPDRYELGVQQYGYAMPVAMAKP